jgi:hypothetical protein
MTLYIKWLYVAGIYFMLDMTEFCSIVSHWLNTGNFLQQNHGNVLTHGRFFYTDASKESIQMQHELSPALVLFIL